MNLSSPRVGATKKLQWASGQGGERGLHSLTSHWRPPANLTAFRIEHDCARNQTPSASVRYRCRPGGGRPRLRLTWHRIAHTSLFAHRTQHESLFAHRTQHDSAINQTPSALVRYRCRPGGGSPVSDLLGIVSRIRLFSLIGPSTTVQ